MTDAATASIDEEIPNNPIILKIAAAKLSADGFHEQDIALWINCFLLKQKPTILFLGESINIQIDKTDTDRERSESERMFDMISTLGNYNLVHFNDKMKGRGVAMYIDRDILPVVEYRDKEYMDKENTCMSGSITIVMMRLLAKPINDRIYQQKKGVKTNKDQRTDASTSQCAVEAEKPLNEKHALIDYISVLHKPTSTWIVGFYNNHDPNKPGVNWNYTKEEEDILEDKLFYKHPAGSTDDLTERGVIFKLLEWVDKKRHTFGDVEIKQVCVIGDINLPGYEPEDKLKISTEKRYTQIIHYPTCDQSSKKRRKVANIVFKEPEFEYIHDLHELDIELERREIFTEEQRTFWLEVLDESQEKAAQALRLSLRNYGNLVLFERRNRKRRSPSVREEFRKQIGETILNLLEHNSLRELGTCIDWCFLDKDKVDEQLDRWEIFQNLKNDRHKIIVVRLRVQIDSISQQVGPLATAEEETSDPQPGPSRLQTDKPSSKGKNSSVQNDDGGVQELTSNFEALSLIKRCTASIERARAYIERNLP